MGSGRACTHFQRLAEALKDNPSYAADENVIKTLESLGIEPGKSFDPGPPSPVLT